MNARAKGDDVTDEALVDRRPIPVWIKVVPHGLVARYMTGRIEFEFVQAAGAMRGRLVFVDLGAPTAARLLLPAVGGLLEIGFFAAADGSLISIRSFSEVADEALLEFEGANGLHRLILRRRVKADRARYDG